MEKFNKSITLFEFPKYFVFLQYPELCKRRVFGSCQLSCLMSQFHLSVIRNSIAQRVVAILLSRKNLETISIAMRTVCTLRHVTISFNVHFNAANFVDH